MVVFQGEKNLRLINTYYTLRELYCASLSYKRGGTDMLYLDAGRRHLIFSTLMVSTEFQENIHH